MYLDVAMLLLRVVIGGVVMPHRLLRFGAVGTGGSIAGVADGSTRSACGRRCSGRTSRRSPKRVGPRRRTDRRSLAAGASGKVGCEFPLPIAAGAFAIALAGNGRGHSIGCSAAYPDWLLPAWLVLVAVGVVLALGIRSMQAPKAAQS